MKFLPSSPINQENSKDAQIKRETVTSAPSSAVSGSKQCLTVENVRHTVSSSDNRLRAVISSSRLLQIRKTVDDAIREHKTFTVKGGWQTIKNQLFLRGWIEKTEVNNSKQKQSIKDKDNTIPTLEDMCTDLPEKQDWESQSLYTVKCERTIQSKMLQNHSVDFYWNMRRETTDWHHRISTHKIMNRFARSLFTSKEGLNLLLQQMHWYCEPGVSIVTFPRCYTLGFADHYHHFVEDFRLTACMSLLKWITSRYEKGEEFKVKSPEGQVPHTAIKFALDRCNEYIASQKHIDIDREFEKVWNTDWDRFLLNFNKIVHGQELFLHTREWDLSLINASARATLREMAKYWPMLEADGMRNIWILKPGNKCRGRGIQLVKNVADVTKIVTARLKYVVQKYIEKPLLIYQTKFDIRQWFLITSAQPLQVWMYRDSYLRFSTQIFNLDNFHESLHLTNHAVQCKYTNVNQRDKALPDQNMWDCHSFKQYLEQIGLPNTWDEKIFPRMRENIVGAMLACQDTMDRRPNTFELYGADFILTEDFVPWLLEINSSPDLSPSTNVTSKMCPQVLKDLVKVIIDKRKDPSATTGLFELVYKQVPQRPPAYLGMTLSVRGRRIYNRNKRSKGKDQKEKENTEAQQVSYYNNFPRDSTDLQRPFSQSITPEMYRGPVIGDLIAELHDTVIPSGTGCKFVPANLQPIHATSKKKHGVVKNEKVSKVGRTVSKTTTNKNNFANRKSNVKENSEMLDNPGIKKPRITFVKNAYFGLLNEWELKNKLNNNRDNNNLAEAKNNDIWKKDTSSILDSKTFLSKFHIKNVNKSANVINKKQLQTSHYCLSSVNLSFSLPQLHKIGSEFTLQS